MYLNLKLYERYIPDIANNINKPTENGFNVTGLYHDHLNRHTGTRPYRCAQCKDGFYSHSDLTRHLLTCGVKEKLFECEICTKHLSSKRTLLFHQKKHTGTKEICELCGKVYAYKSTLSAHMKSCHYNKICKNSTKFISFIVTFVCVFLNKEVNVLQFTRYMYFHG